MASFFLFLNSKDVNYGTSANFVVNFEQSGIDFSESEVSIGLDYAIFPNCIYPIRSGRNTLVFNEGGGNLTATIEDGFYDASNFPAALKTALDAAGALTYTVTIGSTNNKVTISATGPFSIDFSLSSPYMWKILGFGYNLVTSSAASQTGTMPIRLDGDEYYVLMLDNLTSNNASSSFSTRGILDIIPMNGAYGDVIYYKGNEKNNLVLGSTEQLKEVRVRVTDSDGNELPIADNNEIFIKLRVISTMNVFNGQT
jgi:hypothetical protein